MRFLKNKNNKGDFAINKVECYLIFILLIAFALDIIIYLTQTVVTSYEASYFAEKTATQGGLLGDDKILRGSVNSQHICNTCLDNTDYANRISNTFHYFGVSDDDWSASVKDEYGNVVNLYANGSSTSQRLNMGYMNVGEFSLTTKWKARFSLLGFGKEDHFITKTVPFVSEYIPK